MSENIRFTDINKKVSESNLFNKSVRFYEFLYNNWEDIESYIKQHPNYEYRRNNNNKNKNTKIKTSFYYYKLPACNAIRLGFKNKKQYLEFCKNYKKELRDIPDKETLIETIKKLMLLQSETTDNLSLDQCKD